MKKEETEIIKKVLKALEEMKAKTDKKVNEIEAYSNSFSDNELDFIGILDKTFEEIKVLKELLKE